MAKLSPFLSEPGTWVEDLASVNAEIKKLEDRAENLKSKLKLHMQEKELEVVEGQTHDFKVQRGERTDFSQKALAATFGDDWLDQAITKLPKSKTETYRIVARKGVDPKVQEIVDHFAGTPPGERAQAAAAALDAPPAKTKKPFPK
jgi:hypothetical protein